MNEARPPRGSVNVLAARSHWDRAGVRFDRDGHEFRNRGTCR